MISSFRTFFTLFAPNFVALFYLALQIDVLSTPSVLPILFGAVLIGAYMLGELEVGICMTVAHFLKRESEAV